MNYKIMVVDDEAVNLRLLERLLSRKYQVITASSGTEALQLLVEHDVALLITDQRMPGMTGIELLRRTVDFRPHMVRIILTGYTDVSALVEAINCGQVYKYITKPWNNDDLRLTVERAIEYYQISKNQHELETINKRLQNRLQAMTNSFVRTIADALEAKDEYMRGHSRRVSGYATAIGKRLNLSPSQLEQVSLAAFLHDLGKLGTPEQLLLKPSTLTEEERKIVNLHTELGSQMLAGVPDMEDIKAAVRHHHENFDGSGYPDGLRGEQIPLIARIIRVADAYDAMTSPRAFREPFSHDDAIVKMTLNNGTYFDPDVVNALCQLESLAKLRDVISNGFTFPRFSKESLPLASSLSFAEMFLEIEREPALAAKVLYTANTFIYPDEPKTTIIDACEALGEEKLRLVFEEVNALGWSENIPENVTDHALRAAHAARLLAERTRILNPEEAYMLGLLHDLGGALLHTLFPVEMEIASLISEPLVRCEREIAAFGVDHCDVGQWLLESYGLPRRLALAVQSHHDVLRINSPSALLLHLADSLAHAEKFSDIKAIDELGMERLSLLRLKRTDLEGVHKIVNYNSTATAYLD